MNPAPVTAVQVAARARLAARALWSLSAPWSQWLPDTHALHAAAAISAELNRSMALLKTALQERKSPSVDKNK
jgi:hypothetical protein